MDTDTLAWPPPRGKPSIGELKSDRLTTGAAAAPAVATTAVASDRVSAAAAGSAAAARTAKSSSIDTTSSWAREYSVATDGWDLPF